LKENNQANEAAAHYFTKTVTAVTDFYKRLFLFDIQA
jgi:hypothetical protein